MVGDSSKRYMVAGSIMVQHLWLRMHRRQQALCLDGYISIMLYMFSCQMVPS